MQLTKYLFFQIFIIGLTAITSFAQIGYHFTLTINGWNDCSKSVILASYYGDRQFLKDSSTCKNGIFYFKGNTPLPTGMYAFILPNQTSFDIIVSEKEDQTKYSFVIDANLDMNTCVVSGSQENSIFFENNKTTNKLNQTAQGYFFIYSDSLKSQTEKNTAANQYQEIIHSINIYRKEIIQKYPHLFVSALMQMVIKPQSEPFQNNPQWSERETAVYKYCNERNEFLMAIPFENPNIVNTKLIYDLLKKYMDSFMLPYPDSAKIMCDELISRTEAANNPALFRYVANFLLTHIQKQKYQCFENVTYYLANKYFLSDKAFWMDPNAKAKMKLSIDKMALNLCGAVAPDLLLTDTTFVQNMTLQSIDKKVTVLVFWDVDCGHCQFDIPVINELYKNMNHNDVAVVAVYTKEDFEAWKTFVREKKLAFINLANVQNTEILLEKYNVFQTPVVLILDDEKKIHYKNITVKNIPEAINRVLAKKAILVD